MIGLVRLCLKKMLLAVDIGTTNVKAAAFGAEGALLFASEIANQTLVPQPGWSEQVPELVFENVCAAIRTALSYLEQNFPGKQIQGIVFSSAMHGLVAMDSMGRPLGNFMLWSDVRAHSEAQELLQNGEVGKQIYHKTGVPIHPMSPLLKLIWLRKIAPDTFRKAHKFLGIKEYVWFRLTGQYESDIACASATGLMNLLEMRWEEDVLSLAGIDAAQLPALVSPYHQSTIAAIICQEFGLLVPNTPLIIGASDGALANLGSGATEPGHLALTIGTSAAVRMMSDEPILDAEMRTFCYRLDESRFVVGGASNNGANVLEWLRTSVFQSPLDPESFANQAALVPAGTEGLQFLPYLFGERAPLWDAGARASFLGLAAHHGQAHFVRAVMEGVLFNLKSITAVLEEKTPIHTIHISGGFSRNRLWVSMLSEIFQKNTVEDLQGGDASARGAFLLGMQVLGVKNN